MSWLYLLNNQAEQAYKAALKGVKLDANAPQARVNLAVAMLETGQKGVRKHIDQVRQLLIMDSQARHDILESIDDGLSRKPDWETLKRVKSWLLES